MIGGMKGRNLSQKGLRASKIAPKATDAELAKALPDDMDAAGELRLLAFPVLPRPSLVRTEQGRCFERSAVLSRPGTTSLETAAGRYAKTTTELPLPPPSAGRAASVLGVGTVVGGALSGRRPCA